MLGIPTLATSTAILEGHYECTLWYIMKRVVRTLCYIVHILVIIEHIGLVN